MTQFKHMNSKEGKGDSGIQLVGALRRVYNLTPRPLRSIASPLIRLYGYYRLFLGLKLKLWIATGDELSSGKPLSILCAADDRNPTNRGWDAIRNVNYLLELACGPSFQEQSLGRAWLWRIPKMIAENAQGCSLMIVQVRASHRKLLRSNNFFYIPNWVFGQVDMPLDSKVMKDSSIKSDLRRIRKHSLEFEVTRDSKRFDDFYYNMYIPYITKAHRDNANVITYDEIRATFKNSDLLLVTKQSKPIAGMVIEYEEAGPRLWIIGILDGDSKYIKEGAVGALYHFSFLYLQDRGFTSVKSGYSRPFLCDGVLQYKKKWSQRIINTSRNWFALKIISYSTAVEAFLKNNPFIFESSGMLNSAVFVDTEKPPTLDEITKMDKQYFHTGLCKLFIFDLQNGNSVEQESVPPELSERIVFRSADDIPWGV